MMKLNLTETKNSNRLFYYVLFLFALTLFLRGVIVGIYKPDCGGSEENVVYGIQRILMGQPLYQNPSLPDYGIIQYTPLFYHIVAGVAGMLGIKYSDVQQIYQVARVLNILFNLLSILYLAGIISKWRLPGRQILTYSLPVIIILSSEYYARVDSCHLLFFTAAISVYVRYLHEGGWWRLFFAALLCGACVMSKQNGILSIGIIGCSLIFLERKWIAAICFGVLAVAAAAGIAWLCNGNDWMAFYQNPYLGVKNGVSFAWLYIIFISQFYYDLILCYVTGFIIAWLAFRKLDDKLYRFAALGAVISFLFAVITGLKIGSGNNYFTEFLVFVLMGLPCLMLHEESKKRLFRLGKYTVTIRLFAGIAFFVLITSKTMGFFTAVYIEKRLVSIKDEYKREQALLVYFRDRLQLQDNQYIYFTKRHFLDNIFIRNTIMPIKDVISQTWYNNPNTYDYSMFIEGMNKGLIRYVVIGEEETGMNARNDEMPFAKFDEKKWVRGETVEGYVIYRYKSY
jgi:hypothetical protein